MSGPCVVVNKSTVPVGTADRVFEAISGGLQQRGVTHAFVVVSNPEFLKEGAAVADFMRPDRIVLGLPEGPLGVRARATMDRLYAPLQRNHQKTIYMDVRSAELTKYAANAMLATRISFMNELAAFSTAVGADIESVRHGIGSDLRIGYHCPKRGGELKIIAVILEAPAIETILTHLGLQARAPPRAPARRRAL